MSDRRTFLTNIAGAAAGAWVTGRLSGVPLGAAQAPTTGRRRVTLDGRRITVVDVHAHHFIPEVMDIVQGTPVEPEFRTQAANRNRYAGPHWLQYMDREGIDIMALNMNPWWYAADLELARRICDVQNEKTADWVRRQPDRFVGMATCALQFPDLAAAQLEFGVKELGFRGAPIGGSVEGMELSDPKFDPFWAKAQELDVVLFTHPQTAPGTTTNARLAGKGGLTNTIGNPLETTVFLSHMIFEGVFDRFPGLKITAAHAGGYLPSYSGRSDAACGRPGAVGEECQALKRKPSEYFRSNIWVDSMIFHESGLRNLVDEVGVDHIVYGTDFPFEWPVGIDFILNAAFLSDAQKEAILGGNLIKLLRIERG